MLVESKQTSVSVLWEKNCFNHDPGILNTNEITFLNDMMYIWMHYYGVAQPVNLPRALPSRALCLLVPPRTQNELILLLTKINLWTRWASEPPAPRVFLVFSFSLSKISLKTCFSSALIGLECIPVQTTNTPKRCLIKSALLLLPTLQSEDRSHD